MLTSMLHGMDSVLTTEGLDDGMRTLDATYGLGLRAGSIARANAGEYGPDERRLLREMQVDERVRRRVTESQGLDLRMHRCVVHITGAGARRALDRSHR